MKKISSVLAVVVLGAVITVFSHCGGEPPAPEETGAEKNQKLLTGAAWNLQSVTVNGVDKTSLYAGLKITFSSSGYSAVSGGAIWPAGGTWQFTNDDGVTMNRNDGTVISITELTETRLGLAMNWTKTTLGSGREQSVAGQHLFILTH